MTVVKTRLGSPRATRTCVRHGPATPAYGPRRMCQTGRGPATRHRWESAPDPPVRRGPDTAPPPLSPRPTRLLTAPSLSSRACESSRAQHATTSHHQPGAIYAGAAAQPKRSNVHTSTSTSTTRHASSVSVQPSQRPHALLASLLSVHGDHRRGAAPRPARQRRRRGVRWRSVGGAEEAAFVDGGGGHERGLRDRRPRRRAGFQGSGGWVAAGGGVPEEHVPGGGGGGGGEGEQRRRRGREERGPVREGEHGRGAVPAEGGPEDVRRVPGAARRAGRALRLLLLLLLAGQRPLRHGLRGQGRRPHARRRRPLGHVHLLLQEAEDNEKLGSTMMVVTKRTRSKSNTHTYMKRSGDDGRKPAVAHDQIRDGRTRARMGQTHDQAAMGERTATEAGRDP